MNPHDPPTHVVLLPTVAGAPALRLTVAGDGQVLARDLLDPQDARPAPATKQQPRLVLVVPGTHAPAQWLELPARSPAQARAAARTLLQDRLAADGADTHLAVASTGDPATPRAVVAVSDAAMGGWLAQASALGLCPDAVLPDHLALPPPRDPNAATVVVRDGDWLVRTTTQSFRVEAPLAAMVLGGVAHAPVTDPDATGALIARGALATPLDLLQDRYAPKDARPAGSRAWHRAALLAALLLGSVPLLWTAETIRHLLSAHDLEARATDLVAAALPAAPADAEPLDAARTALARARAHEAFPRAFGTLAAGVQQLEGAAIEHVSWQAGAPLRATVMHESPGQLDTLAADAAGGGLELIAAGTRRADGHLLSEVDLLEQTP